MIKLAEEEWIEIGPVKGDTGPKGDTGDIGIGTIIKGHYDNYSEFIARCLLQKIKTA